jgi:hypothetical protein
MKEYTGKYAELLNQVNTAYSLETIGWKIKAMENSQYLGRYDFNIIHAIHAPFGLILQRKTVREVIEYIDVTFLAPIKFVGHTLNNTHYREYHFKYAHDQEAFAELWGGTEVIQKINNSWAVTI